MMFSKFMYDLYYSLEAYNLMRDNNGNWRRARLAFRRAHPEINPRNLPSQNFFTHNYKKISDHHTAENLVNPFVRCNSIDLVKSFKVCA